MGFRRINIHNTVFWHRLFYLLLGVLGLVIFLTVQEYGITSDEPTHERWGASVVAWYVGDLDELPYTHVHGSAFNAVVHFVGRILPFDLYETRHALTAIMGLLGIVAVFKLGKEIHSPCAGFLSALFLCIMPRYYGNMFNNPSDIPFAIGYTWSLFFLLYGFKRLPDLSGWLVGVSGLVIGWTMGVRIGGVLLLAYVVLFWGGWYVFEIWQNRSNLRGLLLKFVQQLGVMAVLAWVMLLMCWPWMQGNPIFGPLEMFQLTSQFPEAHYSFFEGDYISNFELPWYYAAKWILLTLPEFTFIGFLLQWFGWRTENRLFWVLVAMVWFEVLFPLIYIALSGTPIYDSFRHVLFVLPLMAVLSALGVVLCFTSASSLHLKRVFGFVICCFILVAFWDGIRLHPNQYIYFNRIFAGGVLEASKQYETDYWEHSYRQGLTWIKRNLPDHTRIGSGYGPTQLMAHGLNYVEAIDSMDVYLGTTRFDRHKWVPGEVLHVVRGMGVPLLYVIRPDERYGSDPFFTQSAFYHMRRGEVFEKAGQLKEAVFAYEKAVELYPENMQLYVRLGDLYTKLEQFELAVKWFSLAVRIKPDNAGVHNNLASAYQKWGKRGEAERSYRKAVELLPNYPVGLLNLGNLLITQKRYAEAYDYLKRVFVLQPKHVQTHLSLGYVLVEMGRKKEGLELFQKATILAPNNVEAHYNAGAVADQMGRFDDAIRFYQRFLVLRPERKDVRDHLNMLLKNQ